MEQWLASMHEYIYIYMHIYAYICKTHSLSTSKLYHTITGATASADSEPQDHKSNLHFTCILISLQYYGCVLCTYRVTDIEGNFVEHFMCTARVRPACALGNHALFNLRQEVCSHDIVTY